MNLENVRVGKQLTNLQELAQTLRRSKKVIAISVDKCVVFFTTCQILQYMSSEVYFELASYIKEHLSNDTIHQDSILQYMEREYVSFAYDGDELVGYASLTQISLRDISEKYPKHQANNVSYLEASLSTPDDANVLYIELLCCKQGYGALVMRSFNRFSVGTYIALALNSLDSAYMFYVKTSFLRTNDLKRIYPLWFVKGDPIFFYNDEQELKRFSRKTEYAVEGNKLEYFDGDCNKGYFFMKYVAHDQVGGVSSLNKVKVFYKSYYYKVRLSRKRLPYIATKHEGHVSIKEVARWNRQQFKRVIT